MTNALAASPWQRLRIHLDDMGIDPNYWNDVEDDSMFVAALSTSGLIHPSGLGTVALPAGSLSKEDLAVAVRASRGMHNADAWVRGDLMVYIRDTHYTGGDIPRDDLNQWATSFGTSGKRLLNNMTTSATWQLEHRYPSSMLSNTHHEILNPLPLEERVAWAERAASEGLSVAALRTLLRDDGLSVKPVLDAEGAVVGQQAEFLSESFDTAYAISVIASWISHEVNKGQSIAASTTKVLGEFRNSGLIRFPERAWQDAMPITAEEEQ